MKLLAAMGVAAIFGAGLALWTAPTTGDRIRKFVFDVIFFEEEREF